MSKIYLLLDDKSKTVIKTSLTDLPARDIFVLTSISELNQCEDASCLILLEGFLSEPANLAELKLYKELFKLRVIFLYTADTWLHVMQKYAECYKCDIPILDYNMLQCALYQDVTFVSDEVFDDDATVLAKNVSKDTDADEVSQRLAKAYLTAIERERELMHELSLANSNNELMLQKLNRSVQISDSLLKSYKDVIRKAKEMSDNMKQYEIIFSRPVYQKINVHNYHNRPTIIYLKEYQCIDNMDLLLETFVSAIKLQRRETVKVLRLFDSSGSRRVKTLPSYYKVLYNKMTAKDVNAEDFICKTGDYSKVLDLLLLNRVNYDILIIYDCKDHSDTVVNGSMLQFGICREAKHIKTFLLNPVNSITADDESRELNWNPIVDSNATQDEVFVSLSSTSVIQKMLKVLNEFRQSV